ncbi:glutathione hydrolase 1 proenzyme, partial [Trichonephila inaurata madagascariensis]
DILAKNGSAVDAAIAVLLCMGVINPQSAGIGGGFLMLYYNRTQQAAYYIDARETAPEKATEDMFQGNATLAQFGGLAIAIPGEIAGYHDIHDRFGSLPWEELFPPTIKICREGITVNAHLARALRKKREFIMQFEGIRNVFTNNETKDLYKMGDVYTRNDLADTLEAIAKEKSAAIYGPSKTATNLLNDLRDAEREQELELARREARRKIENETRIREARHKEMEARLKAETRLKTGEQARLKAGVEASLKAEEEAKSVEERRKMEEERRMNEIIAWEEEMRLKKEIWLVEEQMRHVQEEHKMRMKAEEQKRFQEERCKRMDEQNQLLSEEQEKLSDEDM